MPFIELQSVDSTNNYALERIHEGLAQHGMAVFAHEQTNGKGQRGRSWLTEKDSNIILSIAINPSPLQIPDQFRLNACISLAVREFFAKYAGDETKIKWPNDIYWQDRKAGGILIESVIGPSTSVNGEAVSGTGWQWAVAGMGININQVKFSQGINNAVSLKQVTGKTFNTVELAHELCASLDTHFSELVNVGFDSIYSRYNEFLFRKNETVKLRKDNRLFNAVILSVTPTGTLLVKHAIEEEFNFGEVEWVLQ